MGISMRKRSPFFIFVFLLGVSLLLWRRPTVETYILARGDERYTHILLIVPIVAALILQSFRYKEVVVKSWLPGSVLAALAVVLLAVGRFTMAGATHDVVLAVEMLGLVSWWVGSFSLCFGVEASRIARFPLLFLLWVVPLPVAIIDVFVAFLQRGSIVASQAFFLLFRVPVTRAGTTLMIPGLDIDVAPECSSIRSSMMLLVTTMLVAHLYLRTPWRKVLLVASAVFLSIAKNGFRIFVIATLGTRVDPAYLSGRLHRQGGVVFLSLAFVLVILLLWILRRNESAVDGKKQVEIGAEAGAL